MQIRITKTELSSILSFRKLFLQACNFQICYDAYHERGWSDSYLIILDDKEIGYVSVKGKKELNKRDTIFEFYILPTYRYWTNLIFLELLKIPSLKYMECQSNDLLLSSMLYEFTKNINSNVILFEAESATNLIQPEINFRKKRPEDVSWKQGEVGEYVLEKNGAIIGEGGIFLHYNIPFTDLYMEVKKEFRGQGLGGFIIQELKKECHIAGRVPAARCNIENIASKKALQKGGMKVSGYMLLGVIDLKVY